MAGDQLPPGREPTAGLSPAPARGLGRGPSPERASPEGFIPGALFRGQRPREKVLPVAPEHGLEVGPVQAPPAQGLGQARQVRGRVQLARGVLAAKAAVQVAAQTHRPGMPGQLADVIHMLGDRVEAHVLLRGAGGIACLQKRVEQRDADHALPRDDLPQLRVAEHAMRMHVPVGRHEAAAARVAGIDRAGKPPRRLGQARLREMRKIQGHRKLGHLLEHGVIAECNTEMAKLFGLERPEQLVGWDVGTIIRRIGPKLVEDLIEQAYGLRNQELAIRGPSGNTRHFVISTTGVVEAGELVRLWGSSTEVTDRVELERRMVTALEEQQRRIGQDLHDNVGQLLTGVRMLSQNVGERHFEEGSPGFKQIEKIVKYASEAAQHVSDLQRGLMPVQMERAGLAQALQELASNTNVFPDVECIYIHDEETDVTDHEIKLQLYRIAQEATNNALKHADPSYIKIVLKRRDDHILLQVEDDGQGFDVDTSKLKSLGLHSMHYRARSINATLEIDSEPGMGTVIHCEVPLREISEVERSDG